MPHQMTTQNHNSNSIIYSFCFRQNLPVWSAFTVLFDMEHQLNWRCFFLLRYRRFYLATAAKTINLQLNCPQSNWYHSREIGLAWGRICIQVYCCSWNCGRRIKLLFHRIDLLQKVPFESGRRACLSLVKADRELLYQSSRLHSTQQSVWSAVQSLTSSTWLDHTQAACLLLDYISTSMATCRFSSDLITWLTECVVPAIDASIVL